jgi:hypothetical protein
MQERYIYREREVFYFLDHCQPSLDLTIREILTSDESYKYSWISGRQQNPFAPELNEQGALEVTRI